MNRRILTTFCAVVITAVVAIGCSTPGEEGDPTYTFDPVLVSTYQLATEIEAGPDGLGRDIDLNDVPILLGYVTDDPMLHADAFVPLAEALQDPARYSNADSEVWTYDSDEHCPFDDMPDQRPLVLDWLERFAD